MKPKFSAVLFDLDDTLVDTHQHILKAFNHSLELQGFPPIKESLLAARAGIPLTVIYPEIAPLGDLKQFLDDHFEFQKDNATLIEEYAHANSTLDKLRASGLKLAIVTGRFRRTTNIVMAHTGLDKKVDFILCSDEMEKTKPHPHPFLAAAKKLGVPPSECLVVGDGSYDIISGNAAGMKTCRAMYGYGAQEPCPEKPDFEIDDVKEVLEIVFGKLK